MWKRRFSATPVRSSITSSGWMSPSAFTGATLIRETVATPGTLRSGLDLHLVPLEIEDVEIAPGYVDGDVVHGDAPDRALELAGVRVAVEDDVGPVLGDRRREAVAAEVRPNPVGLAEQRVRRRRVVEQDDPHGTVRDGLEPPLDRLRLRARLRIAPAEQRLAEVRKGRAGEAADESLRPHDPDLTAGELADGRGAIEHVDSGGRTNRRDLVAVAGVEVVVAEDGTD